MASRGRERRGCPWGNSWPSLGFDQQAFVEAIGVAFTTIAHTNAAGSQGGLSNLQRFKVHHSLTFMGGGDLMVTDHGFR